MPTYIPCICVWNTWFLCTSGCSITTLSGAIIMKMIVLGEGNVWFRFHLFIPFLALWSMDEKAKAEPKFALAKYYRYKAHSSTFQVGLFNSYRITELHLRKPMNLAAIQKKTPPLNLYPHGILQFYILHSGFLLVRLQHTIWNES